MFTAALFLDANGYRLEATKDEIITTALAIATKHESGFRYDNLVEWFEGHIEERD